MTARNYVISAGIVAAVFAIFVALAQSQVIFVPYITPTTLQVDGLEQSYGPGKNATFTVGAKGYGSNCHLLQVETQDKDGYRASFYSKTDDCRFMIITHGPYNFTRSFDYGSEVFAKQGPYKLDVQFQDLVDGRKASVTKSFIMRAE
jgi:hypothetical protein